MNLLYNIKFRDISEKDIINVKIVFNFNNFNFNFNLKIAAIYAMFLMCCNSSLSI